MRAWNKNIIIAFSPIVVADTMVVSNNYFPSGALRRYMGILKASRP